MKSLPARPSLESLRKQAKTLARDSTAGDAEAIARARAHLPHVEFPLTQRNAQLVIAREYGYAGWQELSAEVAKRTGKGLEWAVAQAQRAIHDNDVEQLQRLLAEYPALLSWQGGDSHAGLLGMATGAYGDAGTPEREEWFTRAASAKVLIDAGAVVAPSVCEGILHSRAKGLLELFHRKGLLPRTLEFFAALGDVDAVRNGLAENGTEFATVNEAFVRACSFAQDVVASVLLDRLIALDPELGTRIDGSVGRRAFITYFIERGAPNAIAVGPWKGYVMAEVSHALEDADLPAFVRGLEREPWLLSDDHVDFQNALIGTASFNVARDDFIVALLDRNPAILRRQPPPTSPAISYALTYANARLIPLLTRIWPLPDDLAHAAGMGNLARVKQWFDESGAPALGDLQRQYPCNDPHAQANDDLRWGAPTVQHVLDTAFAFAVINRHYDVADFLLEHGANINTNWNSHEPASILHHLVFLPNSYEPMRYLVDRGIDMTIKDYRWDSTAQGWARYGNKDEPMAQWLAEAERQQEVWRR